MERRKRERERKRERLELTLHSIILNIQTIRARRK
jgi:hypothetical protein